MMTTDSFNPFSLEGKRILVTGASSGIGCELAISCSRMGASVCLCGRNADRLNQILDLLDKSHDHSILKVELTDNDEMADAIDDIDKLDDVVHCSGVGQFKLCKNLEPEDLNSVMISNFFRPVTLQTLLQRKKKINKGCSIVFISSIKYKYP